MKTFAEEFDPKSNSIGFLRFVLASLVIYSHSSLLSGLGKEGQWGSIAVNGFFILSGYLITASYAHLQSLPRFLWHRFLRIMPGFWACLIAMIGLFGPVLYTIKHGTIAGYWNFSPTGPKSYLLGNKFLWIYQYEIADVTSGLPFPNSINGSLWTLYFEFGCYLAAGALGACRLLFSRRAMVVIVLLIALVPVDYNPQARRLFTLFFVGSLWFLFKDQIILRRDWFALACAILVVGFYVHVSLLALAIPGSYALLYITVRWPIRNFDKRADFSYGIYIYAFPVQQSLAFFEAQRFGLTAFIALSFLFTLPLAVASFYLVERPALKFKSVLSVKTAPDSIKSHSKRTATT